MTGSRRLLRNLALSAGGLIVLLPLSGCSQSFVPVTGKVTLKNKQPLTIGVVIFTPDRDSPVRQIPRGKINPDGTYELETDGRGGAPVGRYIVCVRAPNRRINGKDPPPLPFAAKYLDANDSPLRVEVVANPTPGTYDLILDGN